MSPDIPHTRPATAGEPGLLAGVRDVLADPIHLFDRVWCGVDGSAGSFVASTQVDSLAPATASFGIFGVVDTMTMVGGLTPYGSAYDMYQEGVEELVRRAAESIGHRHPKQVVVVGPPVPTTHELLDIEHATLVAVGAGTPSRAMGVLRGGLATELVHAPHRPTLLARPQDEGHGAFPDTIVVGYDGSDPSRRALAVGEEIASRLASWVTVVIVGDDPIPEPALSEPAARVSRFSGDAHAVLAEIPADLVIVGSSGRAGVHALGSVSERVAHHSHSSVLLIP